MGNTPIWPADARFRCIGTLSDKTISQVLVLLSLGPIISGISSIL